RAEMLRRALNDPSVQGGEASMAGHLRRIDSGDRSFVALPVFPLRNFTARDLYVRKDGPVRTPADLLGKRIGMYDWVASGSIWYRLFPDIRSIERDYFRRTGCFPPQHLVILRREVWEREKWIARSLTDAFVRCNDQFTKAQRLFPYVSPWLDVELEETEAVMGADFHPYGFEKNRAAIDIFCRQAHELGIVSRLITAEEYFAEYLAS